jgi:hypothetical protein
MANCKSQSDPTGVITIRSLDLPISCILLDPPPGVTLGEVDFYPAGSNTPINWAGPGGISFDIPANPSGTKGRLEVRVQGPFNGLNPLFVVEDCDDQTPILVIGSATGKNGSTALVVSK